MRRGPSGLDEILRGDHRQRLGAIDLVRAEERGARARALAVARAVGGAHVARDEVAVNKRASFGFSDPPRLPVRARALEDLLDIAQPPVLGEAVGLRDAERLGDDGDVVTHADAIVRELPELARAAVVERDDRIGLGLREVPLELALRRVVFVGADLRDARAGVVTEVQRLRLREADHLDAGYATQQLHRERRVAVAHDVLAKMAMDDGLDRDVLLPRHPLAERVDLLDEERGEAVALELDADL